MVDRTQLTEALADFDHPPNRSEEWVDDHRMGRSLATLAEAVRLLLDFPTDEMVEAFKTEWSNGGSSVEAGLEAVRRVMFGDTDG